MRQIALLPPHIWHWASVGADVLIRPPCRVKNCVQGDFACGRVPFAAVQKEPKDHRGTASRKTHRVFMPPAPGPPLILRRSHQEGGKIQPAREKAGMRVCAPTAAAKRRLNDHLLLQEAMRLPFSPRGRAQVDGSAAGTYTGLAETCCETHLRSSAALISASCHLLWELVAGSFRAPPAPRGYIQ